MGHNDEAKKEIHALFSKATAFGTPKAGRLLQRILHIVTNPNDLVLDSFLGSGTTATVAHKSCSTACWATAARPAATC